MAEGNGAHPTPDRLVAFAQGRVSEEELVTISQHLQRCPGCLSASESMPGDFFVAVLRQHAPRPAVKQSSIADKGKPSPAAPPPPAPLRPPASAIAEPQKPNPALVARPVNAPAPPAPVPLAKPVAPAPTKPSMPSGALAPVVPIAPPVAPSVGPSGSVPVATPPPPPPPLPPRRPPLPARKPPPPPADALPTIPGYQDLYVLGEGGMGVVYRAWQPNLKRWVALKVIRSEALADPNLLARFKKEAQGIARLRHPGIVTLYDISEFDGQPYLLLEYIDGGSLADQWNHAPQPPKEAAQLVEVMARAMHHAHEQKLVHRDLKPGNILLTKDGQPKITDFGLVKRLHSGLATGSSDPEGSLSLTMTSPGTIMGTPNYMAPEQIWGGSDDIDARADVYALGAILYEGLTGRPPFRGATVHQTLDLVLNSQAKPPRAIRPDVPIDLEAVCLKCLAKDSAQRYGSARELGEDLERFLNDKPVLARPRGLRERALDWFRRRSLSPVTLSVAAALVLVLVVSGVFLFKARHRAAEAEANFALALEQQEASDRRAYAGGIGRAQRAWQQGRVGQAIALLDGLRPGRGWEWDYLWRLAHAERQTLDAHSAAVRCVASSPDGRLLATGGDDKTLRLWDARRVSDSETSKPLRTLSGHKGRVTRVAFSPDNRLLASAGDDRKVLVWDMTGANNAGPVFPYAGHDGVILDVVFDADSQRVYSSADDGSVQSWDALSGPPRKDLQLSGGAPVRRLALGGQRLFGATDKGLLIWDIVTGNPVRLPQSPTTPLRSLAVSPDGKFLALATDEVVRLCKPETLATVATFRVMDQALTSAGDLAFSRDGRRLASPGFDQVVRVWDSSPGRSGEISSPLLTFRGHARAITGVCFNQDATRLFSGSADHTVKVWDTTAPPEPRVLAGHSLPVRAVALGPGGRRVASLDEDRAVRLWDEAKKMTELSFLGRHEADRDAPVSGPGASICFSPDGKLIASAASDNNACLWDADRAELLRKLPHRNVVTCVCFHPGGKQLATGDAEGSVRLWDVSKFKEMGTIRAQGRRLHALAFSPDGKRLATASRDGTVKIWDAESGKELLSLEGHEGEVLAVAYSPDSKVVATGGEDQTARLWDGDSGKQLFALEGHTAPVTGVAFTPDSQRLATAGSSDATVRLWDVEDGLELLELTGGGQCVAFSPDGKRLAAADPVRQVLLWDAGFRR